MSDLAAARKQFDAFCAEHIALDLTRGKPCAEQLELSRGLFAALDASDYLDAHGNDCRNYGVPDGLPEMRALFGELLQAPTEAVLIGGNSSLAMMYDALAAALLHGVPGGSTPWRASGARVLCPVPGYDRHFALSAHLGCEMQNIRITEDGLDVESIARAAAEDARVKALWIVPRYQNPTGYTLRAEEVRALARMKTAAPDFRILCDDAYVVHALEDAPAPLANVLDECAAAGFAERALLFGSTSKISFAGGGVAAFAASAANTEWMRAHRALRTINGDKLNQLRHLRFFGDADGVRAHMRRHAEILRPKFDAVQRVLDAMLTGRGLATWTRPRGGYFVSLNTRPGHARKVCELAARAGVKLTPVGATFPHGRDPDDRNLRIAPSFPPLAEVERATTVLATAIQLSDAA